MPGDLNVTLSENFPEDPVEDEPKVPPDLLAWLDRIFPEVLPSKPVPVECLWQLIGRREVVAFLKMKLQEQQESRNSVFEQT